MKISQNEQLNALLDKANIQWIESYNKNALEALSKKTVNQRDYAEINNAREKWTKMCNEHDPQKLVDAFYYNRGTILQGWKDIAAEYSYMAMSSYNLNLEPKSIFMVQPDLVYEIGKCSGNYSGHYILSWVKNLSGEWKISLDSNY